MTAKTQKAVKRTERDAYDDFLDGIVTPSEKKRTSNTKSDSAKKTASDAKKSSASSGKKAASGASKPASAGKKSAGTKASSAKKTASSKKEQAVEAGIVSLGKKDAAAGKTSAKTSEKKKSTGTSSAKSRSKSGSAAARNAVMVVDNPVARGDEWARPRSTRSESSGTRKRSVSHASKGSASRPAVRSDARRTGSVRRTDAASGRTGSTRRIDREEELRRSKSASRKRRKSSGGKRRSSNKRSRMSGWDVFFSLGIVCMLAFMLWQGTQYSNFQMMKQAVDRQTYYAGTTIEGVDVSNMTLEDAMQYWQTQVEPRYADRTLVFDNGESVKASQLGYASDYATVLANAWSAGRSGTLEQRYRAITSREQTPVAYSVTRTPYTEDMIDRFTAYAADKVDTPATEAKIQSFDLRTFQFVFSDPQPGKKLDKQAFKNSVMQTLDAGGGSVQMVVNDVQPTTTKEAVASQYGMITSAITNASSSSSNRLTNIKRSLELINGTCLKPGETFSFNDVVGERTKARGFKEATAYSSGEVTEQVGGGICQVSTTLFNAAVKADLKIDERHNHSLTVGYVDLGKDAAVNWGSQDLRFTNNTGDDIYICCYLTGDKRVRFGIFGKLLPNGETITVEGVTTGDIEFETEYQVSGLLASGEQLILQTGKVGHTAEAYKLRWNANGKLISRELLCTSKYKSVKQIIQYGP